MDDLGVQAWISVDFGCISGTCFEVIGQHWSNICVLFRACFTFTFFL